MADDAAEKPYVHVRGEGGSIFKMDLPLHETIAERLRKGVIQRVNEDGTLHNGDDEVPAPPTERPAVNANKAEWVAWAIVQGANPDDAEAMTKTDLVEKYGQPAS